MHRTLIHNCLPTRRHHLELNVFKNPRKRSSLCEGNLSGSSTGNGGVSVVEDCFVKALSRLLVWGHCATVGQACVAHFWRFSHLEVRFLAHVQSSGRYGDDLNFRGIEFQIWPLPRRPQSFEDIPPRFQSLKSSWVSDGQIVKRLMCVFQYGWYVQNEIGKTKKRINFLLFAKKVYNLITAYSL